MIFKPELVRKILRGDKTQTRRPVKPGDTDEFGITRCRYQPGKTHSVQPGRGKAGDFRITILAVRQERIGDITLEDAHAEGFRTTEEFKAYWLRLYEAFIVPDEGCVLCAGPALTPDGLCLTCGLDDQPSARSTLINDCFEQRHADTPVWVITFEPFRGEQPRFLSEGWPDYTTIPTEEPEPVDENYQDVITGHAGRTTSQWQALEQGHRDMYLRLLTIEQRMVSAQLAAQRNRVSISRELHLVRTRLKQGSGQGSVIKLLERAETKVYRQAA